MSAVKPSGWKFSVWSSLFVPQKQSLFQFWSSFSRCSVWRMPSLDCPPAERNTITPVWLNTWLSRHLSVVFTFFRLDRFSFSALDFSMLSRSWGHSSSSSRSASRPTSSSDDRSMVWSPPSWLASLIPGADSSPSSKISSRGNGGGSLTKTVAGISFSSCSRTLRNSLLEHPASSKDQKKSIWVGLEILTGLYLNLQRTREILVWTKVYFWESQNWYIWG